MTQDQITIPRDQNRDFIAIYVYMGTQYTIKVALLTGRETRNYLVEGSGKVAHCLEKRKPECTSNKQHIQKQTPQLKA